MSRQALGLTYPEIYPNNRFGAGPDVTIAGFTAYNAGDFIRNRNLTFQFRNDLSKVMGSHALKFGLQLTRSAKDQNARPRDNGVVTFNTSARNSTRNVIGRQWDMALSKTVGLGGRVDLQLRAEAFNVFNQVSFTNLNTVVRFDNSGRPRVAMGR